jgi:hypothetical protein
MKSFLAPNLTRTGRIVRAVMATIFLVGGLMCIDHILWLAIVLLASSAFVFFEAARGWCVMRACGIKTKL